MLASPGSLSYANYKRKVAAWLSKVGALAFLKLSKYHSVKAGEKSMSPGNHRQTCMKSDS